MALFGLDFAAIFTAVKGLLGPFGKLFDKLGETWTHITNIVASATHLRDSIVEEINGWKNFKQDIRVRQRVVQLESAVQKTRDLIEGIPLAWRSILDLIKQFKSQFNEPNPAEETEGLVEDIEAGGIKNLLTKFPALARGLEKVLGFLAIVVQALETLSNAIDDIQTIVDELKRLRLEIEKLDTIFLSQSNKRKTIRLADGGSIKIRVGHLHHS